MFSYVTRTQELSLLQVLGHCETAPVKLLCVRCGKRQTDCAEEPSKKWTCLRTELQTPSASQYWREGFSINQDSFLFDCYFVFPDPLLGGKSPSCHAQKSIPCTFKT